MEYDLSSLFHFTGLQGAIPTLRIGRPPNWRFPPRESTVDPNGCANKADPLPASTIDIHSPGW
jgi:hypothetical protein